MKDESRPTYFDTRRFRWTERITFRYEGTRVEMTEREVVQMIPPPPVTPLPRAGRNCGFWFEVHDAEGRVLFHRGLHNPIPTYAEEHQPDGTIRVVPGAPESGTFEVLIPKMPSAETILLISSPLDWAHAGEPAQELARFPLKEETAGEEDQR
jgi:hypothetical protein